MTMRVYQARNHGLSVAINAMVRLLRYRVRVPVNGVNSVIGELNSRKPLQLEIPVQRVAIHIKV